MGVKEQKIKIKKQESMSDNNKIYKENSANETTSLQKLINTERNKTIVKIGTYIEAYYNTTSLERKIQTEIMNERS